MSFNKSDILLIFSLKTTSPEAKAYKTEGHLYVTSDDEGKEVNRVHRIVADRSSGVYFGYDLVIKPTETPGKHLVAVQPLSKQLSELTLLGRVEYHPLYNPVTPLSGNFTAQSLPKYPEDLNVEDGDTIALDILYNPQTKVKIVDLIKITTKKPKDFTPNEIKLRLTSPKLLRNGTISSIRGSEWLGIIEGSIFYLYIPGKGRFVFTLYPQAGVNFRKKAVINDNKIVFDLNDERYEVISESPILNSGGSWNLWVLHDSSYRPDLIFGPIAGGYIEYGMSNKVESLLKQDWRKGRIYPVRPQKEFYADWLDEVRFTITDEEKQTFSHLESDEEREQFINSFWQRRDPNPETKENEFRREYYARIAYANENFGFGRTPGWLTDRGRILIIYGKPNAVQKTTLKEVWLYNFVPNLGNNAKFEFKVDVENGDWRVQEK